MKLSGTIRADALADTNPHEGVLEPDQVIILGDDVLIEEILNQLTQGPGRGERALQEQAIQRASGHGEQLGEAL